MDLHQQEILNIFGLSLQGNQETPKHIHNFYRKNDIVGTVGDHFAQTIVFDDVKFESIDSSLVYYHTYALKNHGIDEFVAEFYDSCKMASSELKEDFEI